MKGAKGWKWRECIRCDSELSVDGQKVAVFVEIAGIFSGEKDLGSEKRLQNNHHDVSPEWFEIF
jgi:hypothetical protein